MKALKVLFSPGLWLTGAVAVAVLGTLFFAYLYPVIHAQDNLEDLPVAIVNEDEGAELGGERVALGDEVEERLTGGDSPAGDVVEWKEPGSREEALEEMANNRLYGAIVIPADYSEEVAGIVTPPEVTLAVVNEDAGGSVGGREVNLGAEVEARITSPDSPGPSTVRWSIVEDSDAALRGIEDGEFYGAVVIPEDYTRSVGGIAAGRGAEPATLRLLTSPAVTPSVNGNIESAFRSIVAGVSTTTSEQLLGGLSGRSLPEGVSGIISNPVVGEVSEAEVSNDAGPLPETPESVRIEVLTNPSAGQSVAVPVERIATGAVEAISGATSERLAAQASRNGAQLAPELAAVLGDPVRAEITEAQPVGENGASGQAPFFLSFLGNLAAILGAAVVFLSVQRSVEGSFPTSSGPSRTGLWTVRLVVGLAYSLIVAALEMWIAFGIMEIAHEAPLMRIFVLLTLGIWSTLTVVLVLVELLGYAGIALAAVLGVILGLVSSGALVPLQSLSGFYAGYADWLPVRYLLDGMRSLLFFDGRDAAGLGIAVTVFTIYLAGAAATGYAVSLFRDVVGSKVAKTKDS